MTRKQKKTENSEEMPVWTPDYLVEKAIKLLKDEKVLESKKIEEVLLKAGHQSPFGKNIYKKSCLTLNYIEEQLFEDSCVLYIGRVSRYLILCTSLMMNRGGKIFHFSPKKVADSVIEKIHEYEEPINTKIEVRTGLHLDVINSNTFDVIVAYELLTDYESIIKRLNPGGKAIIRINQKVVKIIQRTDHDSDVRITITPEDIGLKSLHVMKFNETPISEAVKQVKRDIRTCNICLQKLKSPIVICDENHMFCMSCEQSTCSICGSQTVPMSFKSHELIKIIRMLRKMKRLEKTCNYREQGPKCHVCQLTVSDRLYYEHIGSHNFKTYQQYPIQLCVNITKWSDFLFVCFREVTQDAFFECYFKCKNEKLVVGVKLGKVVLDANDYSVAIRIVKNNTELKTVSKPLLSRTSLADLCLKPNLILQRPFCLDLFKSDELDLFCSIDKKK